MDGWEATPAVGCRALCDFWRIWLQYPRESRGLTQEQLAALIDMTPRVVQYYEAGDTNPPSETIFKIAKALGISAPDLIAPMWEYWLDNQ